MGWIGRGRIERKFGGRDSVVRIGDFAVPRAVTWQFEGSNGDPNATVRFEIRDGRPQCVEVTVRAKPDGRGLRTSDVHSLLLDAMATSLYANTSMRASYDPETNVTSMEPITDEREFWAAVNDVHAAVKAPKRGVTRAELDQVAKIYQENLGNRPVQQVTAIMGYGSERTAARRVQQARAAGLLPETTPGKARAWSDDVAEAPKDASPPDAVMPDEHRPISREDIEELARSYEANGRPDLAYGLRRSLEESD